MKKYAVCFNQNISNSINVKNSLVEILNNNNVDVSSIDIDNLKRGFDFVFVIGGDGTILKAGRFYALSETPVFGINLGRLGFLSQSSDNNLEQVVYKILNKEYEIQKRTMLCCGEFTALNDFVVKSCDSGRTSRFSLFINDKFVCDYLADGIIVSTPTGSTAYGLSAGGPVIAPSLDVLEIVPICPHTLTARPIIIPTNEKITISGENKNKYFISADGQEFYEFNSEVTIKKAQYFAKLALLKDSEFYSVLKNKLHWATHPEYEG